MLQPGDRIGDWIVVAPLGAGGMGSIFLTRSVLSERVRAALKVMHVRDGFATRERFIREVDTLASLNHPAIVRVLSGGDDPGRQILYLFMEYLEGEDLRKRLLRGPLSTQEAYHVFHQVGSGLKHAHERGVTHRDIKPANIMLSPDGNARLVDLGIAAAEGRTQLTREGTLPGTLPYIDPVAFGGGRPDFKLADIYALGVTLWESLTGRTAFPEEPELSAGQQMVRMMRLKLDSEPLDPGPGFPDPLRRVVLRATEPEPEKRTPDMAAFLEQLASSFTGRPQISPLPTGPGPDQPPPPPPTAPPAAPPLTAPPPTAPPRPRTGGHAPPRTSSRRWIWGVVGAILLVSCLLPVAGVFVIGGVGMLSAVTTYQSAPYTPTPIEIPSVNPVVTSTTVGTDASDRGVIGRTSTIGPYKLTVHGVERKRKVAHEVFSHEAAQGWVLMLVQMTLENTSPGEISLMSAFSVIDYHPYTFSQNISCQLAVEGAMEAILTVPGRSKVSGKMCFEVANDASKLKLRFQPDMMNASWNLQVDLGR